jgi:hypothetical protein
MKADKDLVGNNLPVGIIVGWDQRLYVRLSSLTNGQAGKPDVQGAPAHQNSVANGGPAVANAPWSHPTKAGSFPGGSCNS